MPDRKRKRVETENPPKVSEEDDDQVPEGPVAKLPRRGEEFNIHVDKVEMVANKNETSDKNETSNKTYRLDIKKVDFTTDRKRKINPGEDGPWKLMSSKSGSEQLFRQLKKIDPVEDKEEHEKLANNYGGLPQGCPVFVNEHNDGVYFDPSKGYRYCEFDKTIIYLKPVLCNEEDIPYYWLDGGKLTSGVLKLKQGSAPRGCSLGVVRSDKVPAKDEYVWFGNEALGYALGLDCGDDIYLGTKDKVNTMQEHGIINRRGKKYYRTNVPQDVTTENARKATADQGSEIIYYKTLAREARYGKAPPVPVAPRIPDRSVRIQMDTPGTNAQTTNSQTTNTRTANTRTTNTDTNTPSSSPGNTQTTSTGPNNSNNNSLPPSPSELFDQSVYKGTRGYTSYTKSASKDTKKGISYYKEEFRKKAKSMDLKYSSGGRLDMATAVYEAVKEKYRESVNKYKEKYRESVNDYKKDSSKRLQANVYSNFMMELFPQVKEGLHKLSTNNAAADANTNNTGSSNSAVSTKQSTGIATDQEWCHLYGHAAGGADAYYNVVSASHYANTEQLAIEMAQRVGYPELKLSVTAYRLRDTEIALWIRYKIFHQDKKIFDHVFDGQSESFNYHEFKILETTVRRVIARAVSAVKGYEKAASEYEDMINTKIEARWDKEGDMKEPRLRYQLPTPSSTNTDSNTTTNTPQLTNNNSNNNTSQLAN